MTANQCCGATPRDISIGLSESTLAFVYCERCESRQWFRDGQPVTLTSVKAHASAEWNKAERGKVAVSA
ncbi:MAG: hypothetical protein QOF18_65 [Frankiaceae bacterium]|jgi:hypothetical protein|nr:hypothetical protein [Frankiaceae bacterium]